MELEPKTSPRITLQSAEFGAPGVTKPLVLLRDTERSLRHRMLAIVVPLLPEAVAINLGETSLVAEEALEQLAKIDTSTISDKELQPVRIKMGLIFVGLGALAMVFLLLYLSTLHPELNPVQQVQRYWYQYVGFVCLGVAGLFMLGREAMRPPV